MVSYAKTMLDLFSVRPFTEVDSLVLSWLSYLRFPVQFHTLTTETGMCIRDLLCAEYFDEMLDGVNSPDKTLELLKAAGTNPRFRGIRLFCFEQEIDYDSSTQFAALTYELAPETYYIAFRGTDCTLIGWKEDMQLALSGPVHAQEKACRYLQSMVERFGGIYLVGGHSKGGNLAVYAAANCAEETREHIARVFSHDGPGFLPEELAGEGFREIRGRIHKTIPQSSLIGMIFEQECDCHIIKSREKGVAQHNPFSWQISNGSFLYLDELTPEAKLAYTSINRWISGMAQEDREKLIRVIFEILEETGASSFHELGADLVKNVPIIVKKTASLDKETGNFLLHSLRLLVVDGAKSVPEVILPQ